MMFRFIHVNVSFVMPLNVLQCSVKTQVWRQTTWGGWATRQLQALGNHFAPFFEALADAIANEGDSAGSMGLQILLRILLISSVITVVFAFSRILNMVLGREIVVEEEVIVVDDEEEENNDESKKNK